nr:MAG TPA: hypothetical protein [Caudoviricetes sp.]
MQSKGRRLKRSRCHTTNEYAQLIRQLPTEHVYFLLLCIEIANQLVAKKQAETVKHGLNDST